MLFRKGTESHRNRATDIELRNIWVDHLLARRQKAVQDWAYKTSLKKKLAAK